MPGMKNQQFDKPASTKQVFYINSDIAFFIIFNWVYELLLNNELDYMILKSGLKLSGNLCLTEKVLFIYSYLL